MPFSHQIKGEYFAGVKIRLHCTKTKVKLFRKRGQAFAKIYSRTRELDIWDQLITARNEVGARLCFYTCL